MRKEQTLLVVSLALSALVVWGATGKYEPVGAATISEGHPVAVVETVSPNAFAGLSAEPLRGRAITRQIRQEKHPDPPPIDAPPAGATVWVRPPTTPGPAASHWGRQHEQIVPQKPEKPEAPVLDTPQEQPPAPPAPAAAPKEKIDKSRESHLYSKGGERSDGVIELTGPFKGQPDWVLLEKWNEVPFKWSQYQAGSDNLMGTFEIPADKSGTNYVRVELRKTFENEWHEEWIRRGVKASDRVALTEFARWCKDELANHVSNDDPKTPYGIRAVKLAVDMLRKARDLGNDLALTKLLGEVSRAAYDLQSELQAYLDYMNAGKTTDPEALRLVGESYERLGCFETARAHFEKAASGGDAEAKLRWGLALDRLGQHDDAFAKLTEVRTIGPQSGRALAGMARIRLGQGRFDEALQFANESLTKPVVFGTPDQQKAEGAEKSLVLGAVQYARGVWADAQATFSAVAPQMTRSEPHSDRGFALMAAGKTDDAIAEFQTCLDTDPLNLLDPLYGLGEAYQRRDDGVRANSNFATALRRVPDDPWTLLRVGTAYLRDQQFLKAYEMGRHLLEVAPGCTEGLWLVGRAAAMLPKPEFDVAVAHLRRGLRNQAAAGDKDGQRQFLYELCQVLIAANHTDEALRELDAACKVQTGIGTNDAHLLALYAYAAYAGRKPMSEVRANLTRAKNAQPDPEIKKYLEDFKAKLDEWEHTRIWIDEFNRGASQGVGNGWDEREVQGAMWALDGKDHCICKGQIKGTEPSRDRWTHLNRDEKNSSEFVETEAVFRAQQGVETTFHIFQGTLPDRTLGGQRGRTGAEVGIGCDRTGALVYWATNTNAVKPGPSPSLENVVKDAQGQTRPFPIDDNSHKVRILRTNHLKGIFDLFLDDEKIATVEVLGMASNGKPFALGFLVDADEGAMVDLQFERVMLKKTVK